MLCSTDGQSHFAQSWPGLLPSPDLRSQRGNLDLEILALPERASIPFGRALTFQGHPIEFGL
jgi:hypothetical protein